jgi:hypothetical protein
MGVEEKLDIIEAYMGREITQEEEATARDMLAKPTTPFGGSNSPPYIARILTMRRAAEKKTA